MRVMIATGGTGGHVFPAVAVAREIRRQEPECSITFVGRRDGLERREFSGNGDRYVGVRVRPLPPRAGWKTAAALGAMAMASGQCIREFLGRRPEVSIGFGGYVSAPALLAARTLDVPTAIHEQNAVAGRANRWLARHVDRVFLSYEESGVGLPACSLEWCGMPVREEVVNQQARPEELGLEAERMTLFFLGGSQGARKLCHAAVECIQILWEQGFRFQAILQTGWANYPDISGQRFPVPVAVTPFLEEMGNAYACAQVVIARAGASSVAEIAANGLPAIFVPYPFATEDHQRKNVEPLARAGAARIIPDDALTGTRLAEDIVPLMESNQLRTRMAESIRRFARPGAAASIARGVLGLADRNQERGLKPQKEFWQE